jgi:hypothetical protein
VEEGMAAHPRRRRMARFGHRADATHLLVHMEHTPITFRLTIKNKTWKYQNTPHNPLNYTKYPCENTKILPKAKLFLSFLRLKTLFYCTSKLEKTEIPMSNIPSFFFILGKKKYFYCYEYCEKPRKPSVNSYNIYWL